MITSENGKYHVESPETKKFIDHVDSVAIDNYLSNFNNIGYQSRDKNLTLHQKDSMLSEPPSIIMKLVDTKNKSKEIDLYPMAVTSTSLAQQDSSGKQLKYDLDLMYGLIRPDSELVVIQHYVFDRLFRQLGDFDLNTRSKSKKK